MSSSSAADDDDLRAAVHDHDDELNDVDERLTLDEMSHADLVRRVELLEHRLAVRAAFEHVDAPRYSRRLNGQRVIETFGGTIPIDHATPRRRPLRVIPISEQRSSISLAELEHWSDSDAMHEAESDDD